MFLPGTGEGRRDLERGVDPDCRLLSFLPARMSGARVGRSVVWGRDVMGAGGGDAAEPDTVSDLGRLDSAAERVLRIRGTDGCAGNPSGIHR